MISRIAFVLLTGTALVAVPCVGAAKPVSDIQPPENRQALLQRAEKLAHPPALPPVPGDLASPFAPVGFEQPSATEGQGTRPDARAGEAKAAPTAAQTDRDLLSAVAAKIPTTGTIIRDGKPLLISGTNRIEVGSRFTVVYNGQEYELELTAIDRTTFTVRYKGEEFTRPIKLGKSP